jgi:hypothetical protein
VVVVGGGGGGGEAWVVVVGGGALVVCTVGTEAALWILGFGCACRLALCARLCLCLAGVLVVAVDWVADVLVVAATLWLEVDEEEPHALTSKVSRTAPSVTRRYLMVVSLAPGLRGCH